MKLPLKQIISIIVAIIITFIILGIYYVGINFMLDYVQSNAFKDSPYSTVLICLLVSFGCYEVSRSLLIFKKIIQTMIFEK